MQPKRGPGEHPDRRSFQAGGPWSSVRRSPGRSASRRTTRPPMSCQHTCARWNKLAHRLDRLKNGCLASFLVEGGFDSHAPPPLECELRRKAFVLAGRSSGALARPSRHQTLLYYERRRLLALPARRQSGQASLSGNCHRADSRHHGCAPARPCTRRPPGIVFGSVFRRRPSARRQVAASPPALRTSLQRVNERSAASTRG